MVLNHNRHNLRTGAALQINRGFALAELVVALFVFSVGVMGVLQLYSFMADQGKGLREVAAADTLLQNEWHYLKTVPHSELQALDGSAFQHCDTAAINLYRAVTAISAAPSPDTAGLTEVTLTIRWVHRGGRVVKREQVFLLADKDSHV